MPDEFAIVRVTVPSSTGVVSYTDSRITNCVGGMIMVSGDVSGGSTHGAMKYKSGAAFSLSIFSNEGADTGGPGEALTRHTGSLARDAVPANDNIFFGTGGTQGPHVQIAEIMDDSFVFECHGDFVGFTSGGGGVDIDWDNVDGVLSGGEFLVTVILFGGFSRITSQSQGSTSVGYEADGVFFLGGAATTGDGGIGSFVAYVGGSVNDIPLTQKSSCVMWPFKPGQNAIQGLDGISEAFSIVRNDSGLAQLRGENVTTDKHITVTAYNEFNWSMTGITGMSMSHLSMLFSTAGRVVATAIEVLDGSTGPVSFTGLGVSPAFLFGSVVEQTVENVVSADSSTASKMCHFMSMGPSETSSVSAAAVQGRLVGQPPFGPDPALNSITFSGGDDTSISMLTPDGTGVAFQATIDSFDPDGFTLNVTTGLSGRMFVFAISAIPLFEEVGSNVAVSEMAGRHVGRGISSDLHIADEAVYTLDSHVFPGLTATEAETGDVSSAGAQAGGSAQAGPIASDDATPGA